MVRDRFGLGRPGPPARRGGNVTGLTRVARCRRGGNTRAPRANARSPPPSSAHACRPCQVRRLRRRATSAPTCARISAARPCRSAPGSRAVRRRRRDAAPGAHGPSAGGARRAGAHARGGGRGSAGRGARRRCGTRAVPRAGRRVRGLRRAAAAGLSGAASRRLELTARPRCGVARGPRRDARRLVATGPARRHGRVPRLDQGARRAPHRLPLRTPARRPAALPDEPRHRHGHRRAGRVRAPARAVSDARPGAWPGA